MNLLTMIIECVILTAAAIGLLVLLFIVAAVIVGVIHELRRRR